MGVPPNRLRMLRSFDPRSAAHPLDVEDPYYGDARRLRGRVRRHRGVAAGPARLGRRTARRPGNRQLMPALGVPAPAAVAGALRRRDRLRLPVLHRAGALAARQEHQDVARERPDLLLAVRRPGAGDNVSAAPGFVGTRRSSGGGSPRPGTICPTPRCWPGSGWSTASPRSRCWCPSPSTAARPCWSTAATCGLRRARRCPTIAAAADGTGDDHRAAARLRDRRRRARNRSARTARSRCTRSTPRRSPR